MTDQFTDLLQLLPARQRNGLVAQLSTGFYDGWSPCRDEVADLVANELGLLSTENLLDRQRRRGAGAEVDSMIPTLRKLSYRQRHPLAELRLE